MIEDALKKLDPHKQDKKWIVVLRDVASGTEDELAGFADQKSTYRALKRIRHHLNPENKMWCLIGRIALWGFALFGVFVLGIWLFLQLQYSLQMDMLNQQQQQTLQQTVPQPDTAQPAAPQSMPAENYLNQQQAPSQE
jgi:hypothetical protein